MKKNLIVIGAGAYGHEVRDLALGIADAMGSGCPWHLAGFLDDRRNLPSPGFPILGEPGNYVPRGGDLFVCAVGDPKDRLKYSAMLRERGAIFTTLVEPCSKVGGQTKIESGAIIGPFCVVSCGIRIGADVVLASHVTVGHDAQIGPGSFLGAYTFLGGGAVLGQGVRVFPHASILPGVPVGDGATVGAGSVVVRSVPPGQTVFGVPALEIKT
jgi:acetyltransferase-like isoleucine patch superfamily enzyme